LKQVSLGSVECHSILLGFTGFSLDQVQSTIRVSCLIPSLVEFGISLNIYDLYLVLLGFTVHCKNVGQQIETFQNSTQQLGSSFGNSVANFHENRLRKQLASVSFWQKKCSTSPNRKKYSFFFVGGPPKLPQIASLET